MPALRRSSPQLLACAVLGMGLALTACGAGGPDSDEVIVPISETKALENKDFSGNASSSEEVSGVLLASVSTDSIAATLEVLGRKANLLMLFMTVVVFSVAVLAAAFLVSPFEKLTKAIQDVRAGYTASSVQVNDYLETENIVHAFNDVIARMRVLDESRQEFVSNVSHELKTPMTSMKVLADSLLQMGEDVTPEMYREFLQDIDGELDRENQMIEELLSLARTDRKQVSMNISQLDINALAESVLKRVRPLAQKKDVELILVSEREIRAEADEVVQVGGAAEGPAGDVVGLGVAGVDVASGDGAALVA